MTLRDYLNGHTSAAELAKKLGICRQHVYRIAKGTRRPSVGLIARIVQATGGRVTPAEMCDVGQVRQKPA